MKTLAGVVLGGLLFLIAGSAAAFDCSKANTQVEHWICDDPSLLAAEDELIRSYNELKALLPVPEVSVEDVVNSQTRWRKFFRDPCQDKECLHLEYARRIQILKGWTAKLGPAPSPAPEQSPAPVATPPPASQAAVVAPSSSDAKTPEQAQREREEYAKAEPRIPKDAKPAAKPKPEAPPEKGFLTKAWEWVVSVIVAIGHGIWWLIKAALLIAFLVAAFYAYKRLFRLVGASLDSTSVAPEDRSKLWHRTFTLFWWAFVLGITWRAYGTLSEVFFWLKAPRDLVAPFLTPWLLGLSLYAQLIAARAAFSLARIYHNGRGWENRKRLLWGCGAFCFLAGFPLVEFVVSSAQLVSDFLATHSMVPDGSFLEQTYNTGRQPDPFANLHLPWWVTPVLILLLAVTVPLVMFSIGFGELGTLGAGVLAIYGLFVFIPVFFAKQLIEFDRAMALSKYQQGYFGWGLMRLFNWINNIKPAPPVRPKGPTYQDRQGARFAGPDELAPFLPKPADEVAP